MKNLEATLEARRARRARRQGLAANLLRVARAAPYLWSQRGRPELRRVMRSTIPLAGSWRISLAFLSEPAFFFRHLALQDHPEHHGPLSFAAPHTSQPFLDGGAFADALEASAAAIRAEYEAVAAQTLAHPNGSTLVEAGTWNLFPLYKGGRRLAAHAAACPATAAVVETLPHCAEGSDGLGQVTFSVLEPGTRIKPHAGSVNVRLRYHLGLVVPPGAWLEVAGERRTWTEGKVLAFDDAFRHEVQHDGQASRAVLLVDLWHPALDEHERAFVREVTTRLFPTT